MTKLQRERAVNTRLSLREYEAMTDYALDHGIPQVVSWGFMQGLKRAMIRAALTRKRK